MKRLIYLSLILLVACSDAEKAEVAKETDLMMNEIMTILLDKTERRNAKFWQNAYLKLDIALEKYKKADPEVIEFTKEVRNITESVYDFADKNEINLQNVTNLLSYAANTVTGNGTTLLDATAQAKAQQKQIMERANKLNFHGEQLEAKLCDKYRIRCPTNSPATEKK